MYQLYISIIYNVSKGSMKRKLDLCIISDTHLGTYGCQAEALIHYLKSIKPSTLILNGDIIDIWSFKKSYFPQLHMEVIQVLLKMMQKGTKIIYITGNHDELLRKYSDFRNGNLYLTDKYIFILNKEKYWVFHGDVFDATTKGTAKILAKLGGKGYDLLIVLNRIINSTLSFLGREKMSFSKRVKESVKSAVKWVNDFESTSAELAIEEGYDYVICGHIHQPKIIKYTNEKGKVIYMNSGDWVENLTSLEYVNGSWTIYEHDHSVLNFEKRVKTKPTNATSNLLKDFLNITNFF